MHFLMTSKTLHRVVVLVDLGVGIQDSDKMLMEMLSEINQVYMLVLTKADKVKA